MPHPIGKMRGRSGAGSDGLIVETVRLGNSVKITVVDPASMLEAVVVGPAYAAEHTLVQTAIRKLEYLRGKAKR